MDFIPYRIEKNKYRRRYRLSKSDIAGLLILISTVGYVVIRVLAS